MRTLLKLVTRFIPGSPRTLGTAAALRGLRTGDQRTLLGGAALLALGWWQSQEGQRELIYRREVPLGSTVVVRHGRKGELPEIVIHESEDTGARARRRSRRSASIT